MSVYLTNLANSHRRHAAAATTDRERQHWTAEAQRFEELAALTLSDPAAAHRMYQPTRSYEPPVSDECTDGRCGNCWDDTCGCTLCGHPGT